MHRRPWVLAVTKRTAEMCATQSQLHAAGLELLTVADLATACSAIGQFRVEAVIVCHHSWPREERDRLVHRLSELRSGLKFVMRCPGCVESDEDAGICGRLPDRMPVDQLIAAVKDSARG